MTASSGIFFNKAVDLGTILTGPREGLLRDSGFNRHQNQVVDAQDLRISEVRQRLRI